MKIICSTNMPFAQEAFGRLGEVAIMPPSAITRETVRDADLLCIRSTTRVDRALLDGSRVRFVGTATIGTDHMDTGYMEEAGIEWRAAAGCNANSVSEYITAALLCLACRNDLRLADKTIGVIGIGHVGKLVVKKAKALGMRVLQNDPPRRDAEGDPAFLPLDAVLAESDIITLHVPLTKSGRYPTLHLADSRFFRRLKPGSIFINAARGAATDSDALIEAMQRNIVAHSILDTWAGEPAFRNDVLEQVAIGTPHIAGHSFEGKVMGTAMIFQEACCFLGVRSDWSPDSLLPEPAVPQIELDAAERNEEAVLHEIVRRIYDIEADDMRMREVAVADVEQRSRNFEQLRQEYPVRREFRFTTVNLLNAGERLREKAAGLDFGTTYTVEPRQCSFCRSTEKNS